MRRHERAELTAGCWGVVKRDPADAGTSGTDAELVSPSVYGLVVLHGTVIFTGVCEVVTGSDLGAAAGHRAVTLPCDTLRQ